MICAMEMTNTKEYSLMVKDYNRQVICVAKPNFRASYDIFTLAYVRNLTKLQTGNDWLQVIFFSFLPTSHIYN